MLILEFDYPWRHIKPGVFTSLIGGKKYYRCWWLFLAVTYWPGTQGQLLEHYRNLYWEYPSL